MANSPQPNSPYSGPRPTNPKPHSDWTTKRVSLTADTPIAVETDKNLTVIALVEVGFAVYPINPRAVARYRERHGQAGGESDPGEAAVLADILRTDRHMHRRLPANTNQASAVKVLARQHQEAIWALHQAVSRLRSVLLEFYPQALQAFPHLKHHAATTVLAAVPTPAPARKLTATRLTTLMRRSGRGNQPALAERILTELKVPALRQPPRVEEAYGHTVRGLVTTVVAMRTAADELEKALSSEFDQHPQSALLRSVPGLGPVLAARILAEIGDDPARFGNPQNLRPYAGTAPITIASGRSHYVRARKVRNKRLADACHWFAFTVLTKSAGARAHYDRRRAGRPPQRCASQPGKQTPRPPVVVPDQQSALGRARRLSELDHRKTHRCLIRHRRAPNPFIGRTRLCQPGLSSDLLQRPAGV